ncbi:MAG: hypothetical protein AABZ57_04145, partial [Candidatus Margulisiibacteriota bacterium]
MKKLSVLLIVLFLVQGLTYAAFDKKITFKAKTQPAVTFDHGSHLKQKGMVCKSCHPSVIAKMKAAKAKKKPTLR